MEPEPEEDEPWWMVRHVEDHWDSARYNRAMKGKANSTLARDKGKIIPGLEGEE